MEMGVNTEKDGLNYNKWQNNPGFNIGLQGQESSVWKAGKKNPAPVLMILINIS